MKDGHLTRSDLDAFAKRSLPPAELLVVDDHLFSCERCSGMIREIEQDTPSMVETFLQVDGEHLTFEQLSEAADSQLENAHAQSCDICSRQIDELRRLGTELAPPATAKAEAASSGRQIWNIRPYTLIPALGALLIVAAVAVWLSSLTGDESAGSVAVPPAEVTPNVETPPVLDTGISENANASAPDATVLATLSDGSRKYELAPDGTVTGLDDTTFRASVGAALKNGEVKISDDHARLKQGTGALMSGGTEGVPFAVVAPVGVLVESDRPQLSWREIAGARTYKVAIFDDNFNKVDESVEITALSWQPTQPLRRGRTYRWQVTATVEDREVRSPVRPAPDARFKVLDAASADRLSRARSRHRNSHLIMGIAYAEAGFLDEAEREFTQLVRQNPSSQAARRLLQKVRSAR